MTDVRVTGSAPTGSAIVTGLVLAAGAGTRMGTPKALLSSHGTPWLTSAAASLTAGGCRGVTVVLGAESDRARALLPQDSAHRVVVAERWADGLSHSLRAGLDALRDDATSGPTPAAAPADAGMVTVVDMPRLPAAVVRRLLAQPVDTTTLRQAVYAGAPGHPALIGRDHWDPLAASLTGDSGARRYLVAHGVEEVECGDLFDGLDVDDAQALAALRDREGRQLPLG